MSRITALGAAIVTLIVAAPAAASPGPDAARRAGAWIAARQAPTGAFFKPDTPADAVAEAMLALVAGGGPVPALDRALEYVERHGAARARERPAYAGRIVQGLAAAGRDPRSFGGADYVAFIAEQRTATGAYDGGNLYANSLAVLGLRAAGADVPAEAVRWIVANQCPDGGFAWSPGCSRPADTDTTAHTVSALVAAGAAVDDLSVRRARDWLAKSRNPDGGFGLEQGQPTNANSTSLALSAVKALGESPDEAPWRPAGEPGPLDALLALEHPAGGFRYAASRKTPDEYATVQSAVGAAGLTYPVPANASSVPPPANGAPAAQPAPAPAASQTKPTGDPDARPPEAGEENRAGVIVQFPDAEPERFCVLFDEPEITGEQLLVRAGLDVRSEGFDLGSAVCRIGPVGCRDGDCFCRYPAFWGYWTLTSGGWEQSDTGASERVVRDGDADAWVWGHNGGTAPALGSVDEVCAAAAGEADTTVSDRAPAPDDREPASAAAPIAAGSLLAVSAALLAVKRRRSGHGEQES